MKKIIFFLFLPLFVFSQNNISKEEQLLYNSLVVKYNKAKPKNQQYPYLEAEKYFDVIILGEKFLEKYPNSALYPKVRFYMLDALEKVADIHKIVKYNISQTMHYYANTDDTYIGDDSILLKFIAKYPNSKFSNVFRKIQNNISTIFIPDNKFFPDTIYLIVVQTFPNLSLLNQKKFEYLNKGFDIPHTFIIQTSKYQQFALVYRFYSDYQIAKKQLQKITSIKNFKNAYILKGKISPKAKNKKIVQPYN